MLSVFHVLRRQQNFSVLLNDVHIYCDGVQRVNISHATLSMMLVDFSSLHNQRTNLPYFPI